MNTARPILFVDAEPQFGSRGRALLTLLASLDRERFVPHLALPGPGPLATAAGLLEVCVHEVALPTRTPFRAPAEMWAAGEKLRKLGRHVGARLLHANGDLAGFASLIAARRSRVPVVWHVRDSGVPPLAVRRARARGAAVVAGSASGARHAADRTDAHIVPDGVPDRCFESCPDRRTRTRQALGTPEHAPLIVLASRLHPGRGHREFLDAMPLLLAAHPEAHVWIAGEVHAQIARRDLEGFDRALQQHARELGIHDRVHFVGRRDDIHELLNAADLLVHPSCEPEPFALPVAEAKAAAIPTVVSPIGCLPEMVRDRIDGAVVDASDTPTLAARLDELLEDAELRRRYGSAGQLDARARWTAAAHARGVEGIWEHSLASAG